MTASNNPARPRGGRRALRVLLPALIIVGWLAAASFGGPLFGKVDEVSSNDRTAYLPSSSDSARVQELQTRFAGSDEIPAIVVAVSDEKLTDAQRSTLSDAVASTTDIAGVGDDVSPALASEDGKAIQAFIPIRSSADLGDVVTGIRTHLEDAAPAGVTVYVTGPAGFSADLVAGFAGIDGILLGVALAAVLVILVLVYRSLLLPIVVLATSLFALCTALLLVWWLAKWGVLLLSGQTQGILFILVIGAATDYALLFVSRFRESLRVEQDRAKAVLSAWKGSFEPIVASGGTVIAGLLCLLLSDLKSNSALGPVAAIGIVFAMLSALTLLPALLMAFGRAAFWPRRPRFDPEAVAAEGGMPTAGVWARLADLIRRRSRVIWIATTLVLAVGTLGVLQLDASGVPQSDLVLGSSQARDGQKILGEHFPGGSGSPVQVVAPKAALQDVADVLLADSGIDGVSVTAKDSPSGTAPVTAEGVQPVGRPGSPAPEPTVVDGDVMLQGTLTTAADSAAAEDTVRRIRTAVHGTGAVVGGVTATAVDTDDASLHDRALIIPVILLVILLILMMLLRAIVAPVLLIATTVLSFGTAMGVSALVFNGVFRFAGADPAVPLYGFVFLVALGIDYNIFLMTRVREESGTGPGRACGGGSRSRAA